MEVRASSTVKNHSMESTKFTWTIDKFTRLDTKMVYSEIFVVGGCKWQILIYPKGNSVDNHLSMFLEVADSATLPNGWSKDAQFRLAVVNQIHNKYSIRRDAQHLFNAKSSNWGFASFIPLSDLSDPSGGCLVNDTVVVEAEVAVRKVLDYSSYDSKKETGYVGLKNPGATFYMNSLLQTLYHIPYFRKAVYHLPITENDMPIGNIPLALQSLFYELQYNNTSVATKEFTKSFGLDTYDFFIQRDVQELNRVLYEMLEDKMKGTVVEGTIHQLFEGHLMNYIECINVDYKSTRKESFYDLQLDVKGCQDVYASFDQYVKVGDNKYLAEELGLQDAKKGALFIDFPPVLQLQLKRFESDIMQDTMVKINDRYEFPLQLDLDRDNRKYLSPQADKSVRNLYTLHSVLVHSGGVHGGHYYAFIRPTLSNQWFKFDDERVTKEDMKRALQEQYGGEEELPQTNPGSNNTLFKFTKYSNAYMLVYIRESDKDKVICNFDEKKIAEHLRNRLKKEQEEKTDKRTYKVQAAHLYTIIKVARDEDLFQQIGRDIYFDLVDHDKVRSFRIQKQTPFSLFKEEVAKEFGIPVQFQRFWIWTKRQNHTYRPNRPLTAQEEAQSVGQLREVSNKTHKTELKLFLEVDVGLDLSPIPPPEKSKEDILLFFKLYDPEKEELRFVGRLFVKSSGKPTEILAKLNQMAGFASDEQIELYEEIKFEPFVMCAPLDNWTSFQSSQLEDGDIICFQKVSPLECEEECRYPDVSSFFKYVHNRQPTNIEDIGTISLDDIDAFFRSLSSDMPSSSAPSVPAVSASPISTSQVSKPSKEEIEVALKQIKEALQMPPVKFCYPGRIFPIKKALQTLSELDESSGISIGLKADLLSLTEKFKTLPTRAYKAIKAKDNFAQKETLKTTLDQNLKSSIAHFIVKKGEMVQAKQEIQELKSKQNALVTEIKELYKRSLLDKKELDGLNMEMQKYEEDPKAADEEVKAVNKEWKNMIDVICNISANLKFD